MSALKTRQPTGRPPWPIVLLAGSEKSGKSYAAAEASASELVGRTLWVSIGEDDPDEYGAMEGARFEIVEHDGTYRSILASLTACVAEPADGAPNLIVLDSASRLWDLLSDEVQATANERAQRKAAKYGKAAPVDDAQVTVDLWNLAKQRWGHVIDCLRDHAGPSIVTARLEQVTVMDAQGKPTTEKTWKVKAEKHLPFDVGAIVELPVRGEAYLTGVRSLRFKAEPAERVPYDGFTVEKLWTDLGLAEPDATSPRQHTKNRPLTAQQEWRARADKISEQKALRALWQEANDVGELTPELQDYLKARAAEIAPETVPQPATEPEQPTEDPEPVQAALATWETT